MSKVKIRSIIILVFALIAAIVLGVVFAVPRAAMQASAATYDPTTIFSQGTGGTVGASEKEGNDPQYVRFSFNNDGNVYFRRNLALKWFAAPEEEPPAEGGPAANAQASDVQAKYFTMTFAFAPTKPEETTVNNAKKYTCPRCGNTLDDVNQECSECGFSTAEVIFFDRYEISFDSTEENISKAAKATNSIVFKKNGDNVSVYIKNAAAHAAEEDKKDDEEETDDLASLTPAMTIEKADVNKDISIAFGEAQTFTPGEFTVTITVGVTATKLDKEYNFTNIGGNYLEYRSSASSTPSTPITFHTELAAASEGYKQVRQTVYMKELNGQHFDLKDGRINDDAPAVLVLNEQLYGFTLGQRYSLSWEAIDVCDNSVSPNGEYYMLRKEADDATKDHYPTDEDYKKLSTSVYFMPTDGGATETQYVSIRYRLDDERYGSDQKDSYGYVYLSWYAAESKVKTFKDATEEHELAMIAVENNDQRVNPGPYYNGLTAKAATNPAEKSENVMEPAVGEDNKTILGKAAEEYQTELNKVASDEKTSAGNGAYIYLPSFRGLIMSNYADYRNLRFTISYKKENASSSASTESSLRYNNLRFEIDMEGHYAFKVCASDAAGNAMKYYLDGELVDVTTSNIWDIEEIPTFSFDVTYKGADVTEPGEQDPASRGTSFTFDEFEIVDLGSNIKEYTLFYFDTSKLAEGQETPAYSELVENAKKYSEDTFKGCLVEIKEYNEDITEEDDEWADTDNDHRWNPDSSLSFVPQKSGYYVLRLTYYDLYNPDGVQAENYYEVVEVRNPYDYIPAKSDWLQNNVTSVVLFSISGALAIAIVVLFVVKPSDKKVEEVDLASLKGNKKKEKPKK